MGKVPNTVVLLNTQRPFLQVLTIKMLNAWSERRLTLKDGSHCEGNRMKRTSRRQKFL